jgi:hypothetical protein
LVLLHGNLSKLVCLALKQIYSYVFSDPCGRAAGAEQSIDPTRASKVRDVMASRLRIVRSFASNTLGHRLEFFEDQF